MTQSIPNILTIAGIDPSGGAGVLADVKAISALGGYACAVVSALTAQNTQTVTEIEPVSPRFVGHQIDTLFDDVVINALKIGMLGQAPVIETVAERLALKAPPHIVLDPVMVSKSGAMLLETKAVHALREALLPLATLITPNLPEASVLLERGAIESKRDMRRVAEQLREMMNHKGHRWVFLKGGHLPGEDTTDFLHDGDVMIELPGYRIATQNTHGTGCTLSAALATLLGHGQTTEDAARHAKQYLVNAIAQSHQLTVGQGHGPVHHFHQLWQKTPLQ
jgi:hydroxymethylpyrimidine/phosphomethylpyrimidine kinase